MNQDDRLGPYRLLRRLGEGGMGVVHLAADPQGRQVAVKVLRTEVAGDDVARRRLSREVETMRRVRSKYIAEVIDADVTGHRPYIVTRYVPGRALDEIVKDDGPMDLRALIRLAHGVAAALAAVHAVGVIHRDLKPGNVLILDGDPVLIDFGIAQAVDATRLTQTGMFIGTPGYLAPEIIEGQEAGPEVDVHAWAGTLLFAGTGLPPFGKGTLEMIFYNITAGKADIGSAPRELQPLLKAAFQRNPAKRPKAADLAEQTARLLPVSKVPDQISTVPGFDDSADVPTPQVPTPRPHTALPYPLAGPSWPAGQAAQQGSGPHGSGQHASGPVGSGQQGSGQQGSGPQGAVPPVQTPGPYGQQPPPAGGNEFVSLLGDEGQSAADPWPTRRVSPEELRQMREEGMSARPWQPGAPGQPQPGSGPMQAQPGSGPMQVQPGSGPMQGYPGSGQPGAGQQHGSGGQRGFHPGSGQVPLQAGGAGQMPRHQQRDGDIPTTRVRPEAAGHQPPPYVPPYQPPQGQANRYPEDPPTRREPFIPGARQGVAMSRTKAYGVTGALMLVSMTVLAALAPLVVSVVAVPFAVLLRAADLAQPQLNRRRPTGKAAADILWVFTQPAALVKSIGITLALVPYALILGLPVTLLLTVLTKMPVNNALAWGAAVALWTICAGPGVEGPGRQVRRTLSSLVPMRPVAMVVAGVFGLVAVLSLLLAFGTVREGGRLSVWDPVPIGFVTDKLDNLRGEET